MGEGATGRGYDSGTLKFWMVSLLAIPWIPLRGAGPTVEPVTDQETELGQAMYAFNRDPKSAHPFTVPRDAPVQFLRAEVKGAQ